MKKGYRIAVCILLVFSMLLTMSGCGEEKKATNTFNALMTSLQSLDFESAKQYMDFEEASIGEDSLTGDAEIFMKNLFDQLEWEVVSAQKIDASTVKITAKITALDMKPILEQFFVQALQYAFGSAFSDAQPTEEETNAKMGEILTGIVSAGGLEKVTNEVTVDVVKGENGWEVVSNEAFVDALLGGMDAAIEAVESSFSME